MKKKEEHLLKFLLMRLGGKKEIKLTNKNLSFFLLMSSLNFSSKNEFKSTKFFFTQYAFHGSSLFAGIASNLQNPDKSIYCPPEKIEHLSTLVLPAEPDDFLFLH